jgi:hypothetical protein
MCSLADQRRKLSEAERRELVEQTKRKIVGRLLDLVMPNGKTLAGSTGAECRKTGGWFMAIAQKVGPRQHVGDILDEAEVRAIYSGR